MRSTLVFALTVSTQASVLFAGGTQLPLEVRLDQLLLRAERLVEDDDLDAAVTLFWEAFAFSEEHDVAAPSEARFHHAQVALAVGVLGMAKESVTEYLEASGREAESYVEALALLEKVNLLLARRDWPPRCKQGARGRARHGS